MLRVQGVNGLLQFMVLLILCLGLFSGGTLMVMGYVAPIGVCFFGGGGRDWEF